MIKALWGTCDGEGISLRQTGEGLWETTVPARPSGEYTVALWAEDAAGNRTYFCTLLLTYDVTRLCCSTKVLDVGSEWSLAEVLAVFGGSSVATTAQAAPVDAVPELSRIELEILRCERCGR